METEKLNSILKAHVEWLKDNSKGERANLRGADLREADLREANLSWADLRGADLREADLRWADLRWADLREANLSEADLRGASLSEANLRWADLREASLSGANLLRFQFNRHEAICTGDGNIRVGCHNKTVKEWVKNYKTIGKKYGYTKEEIAAYGIFFKICAKYGVK